MEGGKFLQDGDKSPTKPVCHRRRHCQSRYWILWKGSVDHKTYSSKLCDFLGFPVIFYSFFQLFFSALYFPSTFNFFLPSEVGKKFVALKINEKNYSFMHFNLLATYKKTYAELQFHRRQKARNGMGNLHNIIRA